MAVAHRCVHDFAALRMPHRTLLGSRGVGNLLHRRVLHRPDKDFAAARECHLLAVGRQRSAASGDPYTLRLGKFLDIHVDGYLLWLASLTQSVNLAVISECQRAVGCLREETHRMRGELCHRLRLRHIVERRLPHIERPAVAFRQEIYRSSVGRKHRITVLARTFCKVFMFACFGVIAPDVTRHRRCVVFAPRILESFHILIEERPVFARERERLCRSAEHLARLATLHADCVKLCHARRREHRARCRSLYCCRIIHLLAVRRKPFGRLGSRIGGQTHGSTTCRVHHIDVEIAVTVGSESYFLAVRRPFRSRLVTARCRQALGLAAPGRYRKYIALICERNLLAVIRYRHVAQPERRRSSRPDRHGSHCAQYHFSFHKNGI